MPITSSPPAWQRARRPEQKEIRRRAILDSAATLLQEGDFEVITLSAVASGAQLTKSNLYKYFATKEEIFAALLLEELAEWLEGLEPELAKQSGTGNPDGLAEVIASTLGERPRLTQLWSLLAVVLERNLSPEAAASLRRSLEAILQRLRQVLHMTLPGLSGEQVARLPAYLLALAAGLWPMANATATGEAALEGSEGGLLDVDFQRDLHRGLGALLQGFLATKPPTDGATTEEEAPSASRPAKTTKKKRRRRRRLRRR